MSNHKSIYKRDHDRLETKLKNYQRRYNEWYARARNLLRQVNRKDEKIEKLKRDLNGARKSIAEKDRKIAELIQLGDISKKKF